MLAVFSAARRVSTLSVIAVSVGLRRVHDRSRRASYPANSLRSVQIKEWTSTAAGRYRGRGSRPVRARRSSALVIGYPQHGCLSPRGDLLPQHGYHRRTRREATMLCPLDQTELVMSDRQGIEIDYCPKCRGVWLDRGELDKLIERSAAPVAAAIPPAAAVPPRNRESYGERREYDRGGEYKERGHHGERRRKKSFLGDIFDF